MREMNHRKRIETYRDLEIWRKGMEIVDQVYQTTRKLPPEEQYGLVSQMRRAAVRMPSVIAEGFRRRNQKEFRQFLHVALGSAAELETQIEICRRQHRINETDANGLGDVLDHFQAMTMNLIKGMAT
jgi:four helix bundle protein